MPVQWSYLDLDLAFDCADAAAGRQAGYRVRVASSPAGEASGSFVLPFIPAELELFRLTVGPPRVSSRRLSPPIPRTRSVKEYGSRLFDAVFSGDVGRCFTDSLTAATGQDHGLRVRLNLTNVPGLDDIPWEYVFAPSLGRFLALSAQTPVVRYYDTAVPSRPVRVDPPLRVLVMISSPSDAAYLEVDKEETLVVANTADLVKAGLLDVVVERDATVAALQRHLSYEGFHVFHFIGHGAFDEGAAEGVLCFERPDGTAHRVGGSFLGTLLHDAQSMQLAVLNACEGARTSGQDAWSGVGQSLVRQGLPAVVAMQAEVSDRAALAFSHEFYYAMSRGFPTEAAVAEARKAIGGGDQDAEWGTPVLLQSATEQPFELVTARTVEELSPQLRVQELYAAAAAAVADGRPAVAGPLLEQLRREAPGDPRVGELLGRLDGAGAAEPVIGIPPLSGAPPLERAGPGRMPDADDAGSGSLTPSVQRPNGDGVGGHVLRRRAGAAAGAVLFLGLAVLVGSRLGQGSPPLPAGATAATSAPVGQAGETASPGGVTTAAPQVRITTSAAVPVGAPRVVYEGQVRLGPAVNADLLTGELTSLFQFEGHLGWSGSELAVWDETTLGAAVLPGMAFAAVSPAQLAVAAYQQGAANPGRSAHELPVGSVLAVHVDREDYAKVTVLAYGANGSVDVRWVTYRFG
ncbi:MAG TPA: CHAT domain-containing protein [Dermatophilaceae bacterium]|nr:CHAT domain-containing protein [Dermatophilaceae bacterium]